MANIAGHASSEEGDLHPKDERFCQEYVIDYNGARAARAAGYAQSNACQASSILLTKPYIRKRIAELCDEQNLRCQADADQVLYQAMRLAFSDIRQLFTESGGLVSVQNLDDDTAAALTSVKVTKRQSGEYDEDGNPIYEDVVEYKLADKKGPLELLAKNLSLLTERMEHTGKDGEPLLPPEDIARRLAFLLQSGAARSAS